MSSPMSLAEPVGLRERKKARQKQEILDAAIELFQAQGYEETRVADIVDACEISQPTFFRYFPSKDAIVEEIVGQSMEKLRAAEESLEPDEPVSEAVRRAYQAFADELIENRKLAEATCAGLRARRIATQGDSSMGSPLRWAIVRGQEQGEIDPDIDPVTLSDLLVGMLGGIVVQWAASDRQTDLKPRIDIAIDLFFRGIRA